MGQEEILRFLKRNPHEWWSAKQLVQSVDAFDRSIFVSLRRLRESGFVRFKLTNGKVRCGRSKVLYYKHKPTKK